MNTKVEVLRTLEDRRKQDEQRKALAEVECIRTLIDRRIANRCAKIDGSPLPKKEQTT
jgi:hypothetical protein